MGLLVRMRGIKYEVSITFICSYANAVGADIKELMMEIAVELDRTQRQTLAIASLICT